MASIAASRYSNTLEATEGSLTNGNGFPVVHNTTHVMLQTVAFERLFAVGYPLSQEQKVKIMELYLLMSSDMSDALMAQLSKVYQASVFMATNV